MPSMSLARRKSQLELLAQACAQRQPLRVRTRAPAGPETSTRFLALHPDGVLLEWPAQGSDLIPISGAVVDVRFEHHAEPFGFRTETRGRMWWSTGAQRQIAAWKLALPLCVEARQPRPQYRVTLSDLPPVAACCTSVSHAHRKFNTHLRSLSARGLRATMALGSGTPLEPGELLWVDFTLPGEQGEYEFVACVTHVRRCERHNLVVFGALFCPSEDQSAHYEKLRRIEDFVAPTARDGIGRAGVSRVGGT